MSTIQPESNSRIPLSRPDINDQDRDAVMEVLHSPILSLGPKIRDFEAAFSNRYENAGAAAVSSGTAGLYLAMKAMGVTEGEVITPSYGFIATTHAIRLAGCEPRFADVDPNTLNVSVETLEAARTENTRCVIPVDLFGTPAPMKEIYQWAQSHGIVVIEDACEAIGALHKGRPVGLYSDAAVFAFYPNKQITTGEGGMVISTSEQCIEKIHSLRNQGRSTKPFDFESEGFNFRMTEMQAALGTSQLSRLEEITQRREELAQYYDQAFREVDGLCGLSELTEHGDKRSWFVYPLFLQEASWRDPIRKCLQEKGIESALYFPPIHSFSPYAKEAYRKSELPVTEALRGRSLAIPFFNKLATEDQREVVKEVSRALQEQDLGDCAKASIKLPTLLCPLAYQ